MSRSNTRACARAAGRVPPHDLDAEAAVLSAVLLDADAFDRVQEIARGPSTSTPTPIGASTRPCVELKARTSQPVDIVSVATWLRDREAARAGRRHAVPGAARRRDAGRRARRGARAHHPREVARSGSSSRPASAVAAEGYGDCGDVQALHRLGRAGRLRHRARARGDVRSSRSKDAIHRRLRHPGRSRAARRRHHRHRNRASRSSTSSARACTTATSTSWRLAPAWARRRSCSTWR